MVSPLKINTPSEREQYSAHTHAPQKHEDRGGRIFEFHYLHMYFTNLWKTDERDSNNGAVFLSQRNSPKKQFSHVLHWASKKNKGKRKKRC